MTKKINLIPDRECNLDQKNVDLMGTCPYVDVLERMIGENIENYTPLTIGLFGRWGSGKSSIIKTLSERLANKNADNSVKMVIYDAWKYSGDAFRRSFILEMKKQLNLDWEEKLRVFYRDKHEDISTRIEVINKWWVIPIFLMPLVGLLVLGTDVDTTVKGYVSFLSIISSVTLFLIKQLFAQYKISVTTPKIFSPEQFKEIFDEVISEVTEAEHTISWWKKIFKKEDQCKQVVIVFDNIDRCDKDAAKELLLNVKTYLEHNKCIVILPIDDSAIKSHLPYIGEEAEEFLRKIFNVSIRIKGLNNVDRYDFTRNLIKKYELGFSNEVASVISQEFAKNPRRIIQFLNSLSMEQEIALEQEAKSNIPKDSVTKNIDFLAKVLLLKEEYSFLYDKILFDGLNLSNWEELYGQDDKNERRIKERSELKMFFGRTSGIVTPKNIRPYLMLHSKDDLVTTELVNLIEAGNPENIIAKIEKDSIDFNVLLNYLDEQLDTKLIKRKVAATSELSFLIWCFGQEKKDDNFKQRRSHFYRYFGYVKSEHIGNFDVIDLIKCAKFLKEQGRNGLYDSSVAYINSDADAKADFLREFIKIFHTTQDLNKLKDRIDKALTENISIFIEILPYLKKAKVKQDYINSKTINKHIEALSAKRTENDSKICEMVRTCLSVRLLPDTIHNMFLKKILSFLKADQTPVCYKFWFDNITGCIKTDAEGAQLIQWLKQSFNSPVFANRINAQWKESLVSMIKLTEECFILGDNTVWQIIAKTYDLNDDLGLVANSSLKQIVGSTAPDKWNFLDNVITKTSNMSIDADYFVVLGSILIKVTCQDIVKRKPALLKNWLVFVVAKTGISDSEKQILKQYCKYDIFNELCKENLGLAKDLFKKAKSASLSEMIDAIADVILQDPSPEDVRYLIENEYEPTDKIKTAVQNNINSGNDEIEWIKIVIDSEQMWTDSEYKNILEDKLVHLATGTHEQKEQAKTLWTNVVQDKISKAKKGMIEKGISEIEEVNEEENSEDESE